MTKVVAIVAATCAMAGCVLAACGGSLQAAPSSHYRSVFVRITDPVDKASSHFDVAARTLGADPSSTEVHDVATPLAGALRKADTRLSGVEWPSKDKRDIAALVAADHSLIDALDSAAAPRPIGTSVWDAGIVTHSAAVGIADSNAGAVLGLSPTRRV